MKKKKKNKSRQQMEHVEANKPFLPLKPVIDAPIRFRNGERTTITQELSLGKKVETVSW